MCQARPRCRAFSLIEFLMVLFIISVILSIMLPSIMNAREAARRTQCQNNLKQIGLALQNYEVTFGSYPPGTVNFVRPIRNEPEGYHVSWLVQLLPFLEQQYMYGALDLEASIYDDANLTVRRTQINSLMCPEQADVRPLGTWGTSSYAACHHDVEAPIDVDNHGVMFLNSRIRVDDLLDGASNTVLVGEKRAGRPPVDLGWGSGTRATLRNTGSPINSTPPDPPAAATDNSSRPDDAAALRVGGFGSFHRAGGANFSFGDGSVRWVSQTINARLLRSLGNRDDGEVIDHSEF
ncbi:MAG: DUF1559 domain-containing protein [Isosphaeraceae bacterium]